MAVKYTDQIFGETVVLSVATFGDLPVSGVTDQRISITGESGLFNTTSYPAVVAWSGSAWQVESAAVTYFTLGAVEFNSGSWVGTGGNLATKTGARILDTTYNESWIWNSTSNIFVPIYLGLTTVNFQQKIKGDSTTLESGWTSQVDTACTLAVDGGNKLLATAASASSASRYVKFYCTDTAGTGTTNNFYMKCLLQRTNFTMATTGGINFYIRHDTGNGGRIVEFGDGSNVQGSIQVAGKFMDRTTTFNVTYTATANRGDTAWTSETLVQFRVLAGAATQVKIGTGAWHDIAVSTCRTGPATLRFEMGVASNNSPSNIAACKLRYLQAISYT